jgi:hypothetical protein
MKPNTFSVGIADRVKVFVYGPIGSNVEIRTIKGRPAICEKPLDSYVGIVMGFEGEGKDTVLLVTHEETERMERVSPNNIEPIT